MGFTDPPENMQCDWDETPHPGQEVPSVHGDAGAELRGVSEEI